MSGFLEMQDGRQVAVEDGLVLGRVKGCGIVIADTKASRRHARIIVDHGVVEVEDLQSSNGTKVNGKEISKRMLRPGDVLCIGTTEMVYREAAAAAPAAASEAGLDLSAELDAEDEAGLDLSAELEAEPPAAAAPPRPEPAEPPGQKPPEPQPVPSPAAPDIEIRSPAPSPPAEAEEELLEFADDEVVAVRKPAGRSAASQGANPAGAPGGVEAVRKDPGILQYNKVEAGGLLGIDFGQMSGPLRLLVLLLVLAAGAGLAYLVAQLV